MVHYHNDTPLISNHEKSSFPPQLLDSVQREVEFMRVATNQLVSDYAVSLEKNSENGGG